MRLLFGFIAAFASLSSLAQAQSLEGTWLSQEWGGVRSVVEIAPCDDGLCGIIVDAQGGEPPEGALGHRILWGFEAEGDGTYSKGKLKPPGGAPQLNASIRSLTDQEVTIRACLLLICRNETMERL